MASDCEPSSEDFESDCEDTFNGSDADTQSEEVVDIDNNMDAKSLTECVRYWALHTRQDHYSINMIMRIICKKTDGILPRDARTLLKTPREKTQIDNIAGGQYWYRGIRTCLRDYFRYE